MQRPQGVPHGRRRGGGPHAKRQGGKVRDPIAKGPVGREGFKVPDVHRAPVRGLMVE